MAIHFHDGYQTRYNTLNFGDDINPYLLGKLFHPSIIDRADLRLIGIGTILNDKHISMLSGPETKVVFSTGVGLGSLDLSLDETWDIVCVRGPKSAQKLGLPKEKAICDGAILLSDLFTPQAESQREGILFIPHVNSCMDAGDVLKGICSDLGIGYLSPQIDLMDFIRAVQGAKLIITEAMHGAILADTMRTPWAPVSFLNFYEFKWQDWFASVNLDYRMNAIGPQTWNKLEKETMPLLRGLIRKLKRKRLKESLQRVQHDAAFNLSLTEDNERLKRMLMEKVGYINEKYAR